MSRFLIACGGTGGHLSPGIALAETLVALGHEPRLLISNKQIDAQLVAKYPWLKVDRIPAAPLSWKPAGLLRFLRQQWAGLSFSRRLLREWRPDAVVGFGGFTTASIVLAAWTRKVPVALHEANHVPGRAVRLLCKLARRVYLPPGVVLRRAGKRVRNLGMPVRREFHRIAEKDAEAALGFQQSSRRIVILGGSQGATALNEWAEYSLEPLAQDGIQVVCVCGPKHRAQREDRHLVTRWGTTIHAYFLPFCDQMAQLLSCADLIVTRAGAGTLAEIARIGVPAILVPYPHAADNHQDANAHYFAAQGGALVVEQHMLGQLMPMIRGLITDQVRLDELQMNQHRIDKTNSTEDFVRDLLTIVGAPATATSLNATPVK
jgi:UDP-N-acetylglucosamine--N-acetylmuramyl-(pentapeptide) pyrophosphoryl-undecaprenol N-acetylglucosamine transferase